MASFARWCYRHRVIVVIAWLVVLFSVVGIERVVGSAYSNTFSLPGTESSRAQELLTSALPKGIGSGEGALYWSAAANIGPTVRQAKLHIQRNVGLEHVPRSSWAGCQRNAGAGAGAGGLAKTDRQLVAAYGGRRWAGRRDADAPRRRWRRRGNRGIRQDT